MAIIMKWIVLLLLLATSTATTLHGDWLNVKIMELKQKSSQAQAISSFVAELKQVKASQFSADDKALLTKTTAKVPPQFYDLNNDGVVDERDLSLALADQQGLEKMLSAYTGR